MSTPLVVQQAPDEAARDEILSVMAGMRNLDRDGLLAQIMNEVPNPQRVDWAAMEQRVRGRKYTTFATINSDVVSIVACLANVDKKKGRLSKACSALAMKLKKHWSSCELQVRKSICLWHPSGPEGTRKAEAEERERAVYDLRCRQQAESRSSLYQALTSGSTPKMKEHSEMTKRILEATQAVTSTNMFGQDSLAVHSDIASAVEPVARVCLEDCAARLGTGDMKEQVGCKEEALLPTFRSCTVLEREEVGEHAASLEGTGVRGDEGLRGGAEPSGRPPEWKALRHACLWKAQWLRLRIIDLEHQEKQLETALALLQRESMADREAVASAPSLAQAAVPESTLPVSAASRDMESVFSAAAFGRHPFFRECLHAVAVGDPDALFPHAAFALHRDSQPEMCPATAHAAFGSLCDRSVQLCDFIEGELGACRTTVPLKSGPSKGPPRKISRGLSRGASLGAGLSSAARDASLARRRTSGASALPPHIVQLYMKRRGGGSGEGATFVPGTRELTEADIAARLAAEGDSGEEEDGTDAYYEAMHSWEQAKALEREAQRGVAHRRDSMRSDQNGVREQPNLEQEGLQGERGEANGLQQVGPPEPGGALQPAQPVSSAERRLVQRSIPDDDAANQGLHTGVNQLGGPQIHTNSAAVPPADASPSVLASNQWIQPARVGGQVSFAGEPGSAGQGRLESAAQGKLPSSAALRQQKDGKPNSNTAAQSPRHRPRSDKCPSRGGSPPSSPAETADETAGDQPHTGALRKRARHR